MRLAVYNVENLFDRPRAMNLGSWREGKAILQDFADLCGSDSRAATTHDSSS
jgi:hypothetical protein